MLINTLEIKSLMAKKNIKVTDLAEKLGMERSKIAAWFHRGKIPDSQIETYHKICKIVGYNDSVAVVAESRAEYANRKIPYFDIDVSAGEVSFVDNLVAERPTDYYSIPGLQADFIVPVFGDSMVDAISPGDKIAVKRLNDLDIIPFGKKYLIITAEHRMVKIVRRHANPDYITLESKNPSYDPMDVPLKKVKALFKVVEILKREEI